eukprot:14505111-Ditylum_brightwellii.AAC.1
MVDGCGCVKSGVFYSAPTWWLKGQSALDLMLCNDTSQVKENADNFAVVSSSHAVVVAQMDALEEVAAKQGSRAA